MSDHNTRLQAIEASLRRIASKLGIAGIDHRPAPLPRRLSNYPDAFATGSNATHQTASRGAPANAAHRAQSSDDRTAYRTARLQERARLATIFAAPVAMRDPGLTFLAADAMRKPSDVIALLEKMRPVPSSEAVAPAQPNVRQIMQAAERARAERV